jgi:hypothetical protein
MFGQYIEVVTVGTNVEDKLMSGAVVALREHACGSSFVIFRSPSNENGLDLSNDLPSN